MQCPHCRAEQPDHATYCALCGTSLRARSAQPDPLDVIPPVAGLAKPQGPTGRFALGRQTAAPTVLAPSRWTYPMRVAVLAWLLISAAVDVISVLSQEDLIRHAAYPTSQVTQGQLSHDQGVALTHLVFEAILVGLGLWLLVKFGLALGAYSGRTAWSFYGCLALVGITALFSLLSLANLTLQLMRGRDVRLTLVVLLIQAGAVALLVWMLVGLRRFGPWAATRVQS
jgi:hypothetical protein